MRKELREAAVVGVKACLEEGLRQELTKQIGYERYERKKEEGELKKAQRSGYFKRKVSTDHGEIGDLRVPKLRKGNKEREWQILNRYQRCLQYVLDGLLYLYVMGLSVRDLQEGLYVQYGNLLSVSAVNQVTIHIQKEVEKKRTAKLEQTPEIILVDGVWVTILYPTGEKIVDKAGHERKQQRGEERVILAAMAIWADGSYQLLHYEIAENEDEANWKAFWQHLIERGLEAQTVKLVVSDGTKGLLKAMSNYLPNTKLQRCTVHKVRGFERYLSYQDLPEFDPDTQQPLSPNEAKAQRKAQICQDAHNIFKEPTLAQAQERLAQFIHKWQPFEPQAVRNFNWGLKRCFVFYEFDPALYTRIHSTNLLERFFREFRAKADEIGSFPNDKSCLTIFYIVMLRDHAKHHRLDFAKNSKH